MTNEIAIKYRELSYETLARIIELANRLSCTPEQAAVRFLASRAKAKTEEAA